MRDKVSRKTIVDRKHIDGNTHGLGVFEQHLRRLDMEGGKVHRPVCIDVAEAWRAKP